MSDAHNQQFTDPKSVAADIAREFRENEKRWTQGCWARNARGERCGLRSDEAVCWCLRGAIDKRLLTTHSFVDIADDVYRAFDHALWIVLEYDGASSHPLSFVAWNDSPERTVNEVIALCEKVACG